MAAPRRGVLVPDAEGAGLALRNHALHEKLKQRKSKKINKSTRKETGGDTEDQRGSMKIQRTGEEGEGDTGRSSRKKEKSNSHSGRRGRRGGGGGRVGERHMGGSFENQQHNKVKRE